MKNNLTTVLTTVIFLVFMQSCTLPNPYQNSNSEDENQSGFNGISSSNGSSKSHNMGLNCMNCHRPGGGEAPTWQVAGTVYDQALLTPYANATVNLYTGPNGTGILKYTIKVDARGNFYTSKNIDFTGGLYPTVSGSTVTNFMSSSITTGACNSCHNSVSMDRIWVK